MESAAKVLGHLGKKLRTHSIHVRRTENGMVARHELRDEDNNPPMDGQHGEKEYNISNLAQLASHFAEHMPDPDKGPDGEQGEAQPGA